MVVVGVEAFRPGMVDFTPPQSILALYVLDSGRGFPKLAANKRN
jgi:hypothetical protein